MSESSEQKKKIKTEDTQRFNEQCFLIDNMKRLSRINISETTKYPYKNFMMVNDDPAMAVQYMVGKSGIEDLFSITPAQVALLVPKIRIWKVVYENEKDKKGKDHEIVFTDFTSPSSINNLTRNANSRGSEVGLKKFSYKLSGKNPAEGGLAECTLVLFFQNIQSLFNEEVDTKTARFTDLITRRKKVLLEEDKKKVQAYEEKYFRIKIETGWAVPQDPSNALNFSTSLKEAIRKSTTVFFLTLKSHSLDFNENGSLTMTLEYQGAMEGALKSDSVDLLKISPVGVLAKKMKDELSQTDKQKTTASGPSGTREETKRDKTSDSVDFTDNWVTGFESIEAKEQTAGQFGATLKGKKIRARAYEAQDKQIRYSRLIKSLYDKAKIYFINISPQYIEGWSEEVKKVLEKATQDKSLSSRDIEALKKGIEEGNIKKTQEGRRITASPFPPVKKISGKSVDLEIAYGTIEQATEITREFVNQDIGLDSSWKDIFTQKIERFRPKDRKDSAKVVEAGIEAHSKYRKSKNSTTEKDYKTIQFFYFGDLLDAAFSIITKEEIKIILGPIVFIDPRTGNAEVQNIADIPISLNLFSTWWLRTVVAPQKEKYFLSAFINDAFTKLIMPALGPTCFSTTSGTQVSNISVVLLDPPEGKIPFKSGKRISLVEEFANKKTDNVSKGTSPKRDNVLYISVSNWATNKLRGDRAEDFKKGIYHISMGADHGVVKGIKFNKDSQKYLAEARVVSDTEGDYPISNRLRDAVYNVSVSMIGNCLFRPGVYVFVDTGTMGNGLNPLMKNSWAHLLGLGGYYMVTSIEHVLDGSDYETGLECKWVSSGADDSSIKASLKKRPQKATEEIVVEEHYK